MIEKINLFFIFINFIIQSKEFHGIEKVFFENIKVLIYNTLHFHKTGINIVSLWRIKSITLKYK
ncbi:MAG: hypothetical protein D4R91_03290 [Sediminibacterium sp.]|nr:MAG: hypothetical protein D4R91_03290 [Sediminibacterium sp.]